MRIKINHQEIIKNFIFLVNKPKIKKFFFNFVKSHIIFVGFLQKKGDLYAILFYTIILALYSLRLLGIYFSFIFCYILATGFLLLFSMNFPPLRKKMFEFFGAKFILKHLGQKIG